MMLRKILAGVLALAALTLPALAQVTPGTSPLSGSKGGTNNAFMQFTGPATSMKTFTLPNASGTIAVYNAIGTWTAVQTFNDATVVLLGSSLGTNVAAPSTPSAGTTRFWSDSTDKRLHDKNDAGVVGTTAVASTCSSSNWFRTMSSAGAFGCSQPSFTDLTGSLACSQHPALTGDITTSAGSCATTLANTAVTPNSYGSATVVATFTVDAKGRLTAASNATITGVNGMAVTACSGCTLTIANSKTATVSNTLTFTGTDGSSVAFGTGGAASYTIASGTKALATGAIASATCTSAQTDTATGATTSSVVDFTFASDPTAVTGYTPSTGGMLTIIPWVTANTVNFKVCNNTVSSITPGAISLNWRVRS